MSHFNTPDKKLSAIVLKLLDNEEKVHGYLLTQRFKSVAEVPVKEGVLYPTLYLLEAKGLLKAETEAIGKRVRKYYSLSEAGKKASK